MLQNEKKVCNQEVFLYEYVKKNDIEIVILQFGTFESYQQQNRIQSPLFINHFRVAMWERVGSFCITEMKISSMRYRWHKSVQLTDRASAYDECMTFFMNTCLLLCTVLYILHTSSMSIVMNCLIQHMSVGASMKCHTKRDVCGTSILVLLAVF